MWHQQNWLFKLTNSMSCVSFTTSVILLHSLFWGQTVLWWINTHRRKYFWCSCNHFSFQNSCFRLTHYATHSPAEWIVRWQCFFFWIKLKSTLDQNVSPERLQSWDLCSKIRWFDCKTQNCCISGVNKSSLCLCSKIFQHWKTFIWGILLCVIYWFRDISDLMVEGQYIVSVFVWFLFFVFSVLLFRGKRNNGEQPVFKSNCSNKG